MQMRQANPYETYRQQSVMTMRQGEMLTKLYDETIKQLSAAVLHLESKDYGLVNAELQKAQRIINYLRSTIDFQYKVSNGLAALYTYFIERIVQANIRKDPAPVQEILPMVEELRDVFIQADRAARIK